VPDLETVDLEGVEIMAAGERVHGRGSPPEGDVYDVAQLERLAETTNAALDTAKPFVKLGHNPEQSLLRAEGFYDDDQPQTGRLLNLRVDGEKLKTDLKGVPRKLADLIGAGAFPWRSTELKDHDGGEIVSALAWLGSTPPAFKTLADVAALYADQPASGEQRFAVAYAASEVWPRESYEWLRSEVDAQLNPRPAGGPYVEPQYWVRDVADGRALVQQGWGDDAPAWVVPFTTTDGLQLAPAGEWVLAEQTWAAAAREMAAEETQRRASADTRRRMPDQDTPLRSFAEAAGLEGEASSDQILDAVRKLVADKTALETKATEAEGKATEYADKLASVEPRIAAGEAAAEELRIMRRDRLFAAAVDEKRIAPAQVAKLTEQYDASPAAAAIVTELVEGLQPRSELERAFGADPAERDAQEAVERELAVMPGTFGPGGEGGDE
jgi:hypothetical protein